MKRRAYLRSAALVTVGVAGCLESEPEAANEFDYHTHPKDEVDVPLVPVNDAHEWYENGEAAFVDARSEVAYERARIAGALHSPAPDGQENGDPVAELDTDRRIVTYCGCPHHLSALRGASLIREGYVHTYAIMEGFDGWRRNDYPLEGSSVEETPDQYTIEGRTDPAFDGEFAWIWHDASGQREAAPIDESGGFTLNVRFYGVDPTSTLRLEVPGGSTTRPLSEFTGRTVEL